MRTKTTALTTLALGGTALAGLMALPTPALACFQVLGSAPNLVVSFNSSLTPPGCVNATTFDNVNAANAYAAAQNALFNNPNSPSGPSFSNNGFSTGTDAFNFGNTAPGGGIDSGTDIVDDLASAAYLSGFLTRDGARLNQFLASRSGSGSGIVPLTSLPGQTVFPDGTSGGAFGLPVSVVIGGLNDAPAPDIVFPGGGGIFQQPGFSGGVRVAAGDVNGDGLSDIISINPASGSGGPLDIDSGPQPPASAGGGIFFPVVPLTIENSTLSINTAGGDDAGIGAGGTVSVPNSTVSGNTADGNERLAPLFDAPVGKPTLVPGGSSADLTTDDNFPKPSGGQNMTGGNTNVPEVQLTDAQWAGVMNGTLKITKAGAVVPR